MPNKTTTYKCKYCGQEINANTKSQLVFCGCGKLGVDGNEHYVRVLGEQAEKIVDNK